MITRMAVIYGWYPIPVDYLAGMIVVGMVVLMIIVTMVVMRFSCRERHCDLYIICEYKYMNICQAADMWTKEDEGRREY